MKKAREGKGRQRGGFILLTLVGVCVKSRWCIDRISAFQNNNNNNTKNKKKKQIRQVAKQTDRLTKGRTDVQLHINGELIDDPSSSCEQRFKNATYKQWWREKEREYAAGHYRRYNWMRENERLNRREEKLQHQRQPSLLIRSNCLNCCCTAVEMKWSSWWCSARLCSCQIGGTWIKSNISF